MAWDVDRMLSTEVLVKGVFLGLALHAARILGLADHACWRELGLTLACAAGGLALGSLAAMSRKRGGAFASRLVLGLLVRRLDRGMSWLPTSRGPGDRVMRLNNAG